MGLLNSQIIADYLNRNPDPLFAIELTNTMVTQYNKLKSAGLDNASIFNDMWSFASGEHSEFEYQAAALGILTYFFEKCEVFEK